MRRFSPLDEYCVEEMVKCLSRAAFANGAATHSLSPGLDPCSPPSFHDSGADTVLLSVLFGVTMLWLLDRWQAPLPSQEEKEGDVCLRLLSIKSTCWYNTDGIILTYVCGLNNFLGYF